jgi:hypothetical protein
MFGCDYSSRPRPCMGCSSAWVDGEWITYSVSVACPALPCFSALFHKRYDFRKEAEEHTCVFTFSATTV